MNRPESLASLAASVTAPDFVRHPRILGWVREFAVMAFGGVLALARLAVQRARALGAARASQPAGKPAPQASA